MHNQTFSQTAQILHGKVAFEQIGFPSDQLNIALAIALVWVNSVD
jgi:hypothetical protein